MAFSASDAAFEGFRITRERPLPVLIWSLVYLVVGAVGSALVVLMVGEDMNTVLQGAAASDPAQAMTMLPVMGKMYAIALPLGILWTAFFSAAVFRAVLRPEDSRGAYLRFSRDELMIALLYIVLLIVSFVVLFGVTAVATLAAMPLAMLAGPVGAAALGMTVSFVAIIGTMAWIGVRLSLAGPTTFATGKIDLKGAWRLSVGRFWPMLGCYILAAVLATIVGLLGFVIVLAAAAGIGGGMTAITQPDYSSLGAYFTPARIVQLVVSSVVSTLQYVILFAPAAAIYRSLRNGEGAEDHFV